MPVVLDRTMTRFYTFAPGAPSTLAGNEEAALTAAWSSSSRCRTRRSFRNTTRCRSTPGATTNCCLPQGATEATLLGTFQNLQPGDVLIFQEIIGPQTGNPADADIRHRCAVRLTAVATHDAQGNQLVDPLFEDVTGAPITSAGQKPTPVTEIQWAESDALPFPVCLSSKYIDSQQKEQVVPKVTIVLGNIPARRSWRHVDRHRSWPSAPAQAVPSA